MKYNFSQAKQILDMFRLLCQGQSEPHQMLCELFDAQTEHGQDMSYYNKQIQQATAAIAQQFGQKNRHSLFAGRGAKLMKSSEQISTDTSYELITWLIIQPAGK